MAVAGLCAACGGASRADPTGGASGGSSGANGSRSGGSGGTAVTSGGSGTGGSDSAAGGANGGTMGGAGTTGSGGGTGCAAKSALPGETTKTIQVGGTSRTFILHIPSTYTGATAVPLVLDFHGLGGTGSGEKGTSGFAALSDRDGFVIAWPNGIDNAWNIGPCCTNSRDVDDLGFAKGIVAAIAATACIDPKRIYATGFSMGGGMSHFLACNAADLFAAVAPSSFDLLVADEEPCQPSRPISVLSFRGTNDTVVPYAGGKGSAGKVTFLGAMGTLMKWAQLDTCTGTPTTSGSEQLYTQCAAGVEVGLYTVQGGGHAPGPAGTAWDFLKAKTLP
jgi:polyhydroxybutyrate depolymerase